MKIAVPCVDGKLCMHFGHCDLFALVEVDAASKTIAEETETTPPPHAPGVLRQWLAEQGVTVVIAGGKKIPEADALNMAHKAIQQGAQGVDMGRNIFCAGDPVAMVRAVRAVVHDNEPPDKALDMYETMKNEKE